MTAIPLRPTIAAAAAKSVSKAKVFDLNKASSTMFQKLWETQNPTAKWTVGVARQGKLFFDDTLKPMSADKVAAIKAADSANTSAALDSLLNHHPELKRVVDEARPAVGTKYGPDLFGRVKRLNFIVEAESKYEVPMSQMPAIEAALATKSIDELFTAPVAAQLKAAGYSIEKVGGAGADGKRQMVDPYQIGKDSKGKYREDITIRQRMVGAQQVANKDPNATIGRIDVKLSGERKGANEEVFERLEITLKSLTAAEIDMVFAGNVPAEFNPIAQLMKVTDINPKSLRPLVTIDDSRFEFFLGKKDAQGVFQQEYLITADSITGFNPMGKALLGELEFERSVPPPNAAAEKAMHDLSGSIGEKIWFEGEHVAQSHSRGQVH